MVPDDENRRAEVNPYSSPSASAADFVAEPDDDERTAALRAFVGPNADRYLRKWSAVLRGDAGGTGFNWPAFFFSGLWLGYRKMYKATIILWGLVVAETLVQEAIVSVVMARPDVSAVFDRIVNLVVAIVCGGFGNRWYLTHATRAIDGARAEGLEGDELLATMAHRGGTNLLASLGLFVLFLVSIFLVLIGLAATGLYVPE